MPSVEVPHANHPLFRKELTQVTSKKIFIWVCDPHKKFCKYLKFQNHISTTNENYYVMFKKFMWGISAVDWKLISFARLSSNKFFRRFVLKGLCYLPFTSYEVFRRLKSCVEWLNTNFKHFHNNCDFAGYFVGFFAFFLFFLQFEQRLWIFLYSVMVKVFIFGIESI